MNISIIPIKPIIPIHFLYSNKVNRSNEINKLNEIDKFEELFNYYVNKDMRGMKNKKDNGRNKKYNFLPIELLVNNQRILLV